MKGNEGPKPYTINALLKKINDDALELAEHARKVHGGSEIGDSIADIIEDWRVEGVRQRRTFRGLLKAAMRKPDQPRI